MSFRINTNVAALTAHMYTLNNNKGLDTSLTRLSSGLRINKAADDASGLAIANQLGAQANGLGQAIRNANDGINLVQTADGALGEYTKIINTVRTKSIQAASDGQNANSRKTIQQDITKLLQEAQNIAKTTSFNGQNLLDGNFANKNFQVGAYANQTVGITIGNAQTTVIGQFAEAVGSTVVPTATTIGTNDLKINGTELKTALTTASSASNIGSAINEISSSTGVTAAANTQVVGGLDVAGGSITAGTVFINGKDLGSVTFSNNDSTGTLVTAINNLQSQTGVTASISNNKLVLTDASGGDIKLSTTAAGGTVTASAAGMFGAGSTVSLNGGTAAALTEVSKGAITLDSDNAIAATIIGSTTLADFGLASLASGSFSLSNALSDINVSTYKGAQKAIKITDAALRQIDAVRSNIGSTQNQLQSTVRNISVTQVNVTSAKSSIMDVDFGAESANFAKHNILAQSGSYAMSQANLVQKNVLKLLR